MMKAMYGDRGAFRFQFAHFLPETRMRRKFLQFVVLIVGDYGEYRTNPEFADEVPHSGPTVTVHGGTNVVNSQQVLRRAGQFLHACGPFSILPFSGVLVATVGNRGRGFRSCK